LNDKLSAFLNLTRRHDDDRELVDIDALVADAARLAEPFLSAQGLLLETDIPDDLPRIRVRKASVRDALLNVLINAAQSGQSTGAVRVSASIDGRNLRIAVEDRGAGIPVRQLPKLFDAFYTTRADGTGLGLAIVQRVVAAHQGQVHAENRPGGGARILLRLPLQPKEVPEWWKRPD
jgi:signal transduction histidine kinase